jgi:hypothetical protein
MLAVLLMIVFPEYHDIEFITSAPHPCRYFFKLILVSKNRVPVQCGTESATFKIQTKLIKIESGGLPYVQINKPVC